ncbi:MAG: CDP-alcohol phosphatidyltransferase family protein [Elusimicrobiota bacterium]|nr:CDP-alcohol phosphatidyltransferase family protein [Elusimicrobiota bacterium]
MSNPKIDLSLHKTPFYKSYKMEEFLDIYFYHPLGLVFAKIAYKAGLKPNHVSLLSMLIGVIGGIMLVSGKTALWGVAFIVFSSVLDSSDGQLARITGTSSLAGRVLDGLIGYAAFSAAYLAIAFNYLYQHAGAFWIFIIMLGAGFFSSVHSSMYDYYRTTFARITSGGTFVDKGDANELSGFFEKVYSTYDVYQNFFAASHMRVLKFLDAKATNTALKEKIALMYEEHNLKNVHGWNMLGDNSKILGILFFVVLGREYWYFLYVIFFLTIIFIIMFFVQRISDFKFLKKVEAEILK